jgi:hypothetical protein
MVTSKKIARGVGVWVDNEILPMMSGTTKYGLSVATAMGATWLEKKLDQAQRSEIARELGVAIDGGFDLAALKTTMLDRFPEDGLRVEAEQINSLVNRFLGKLGPILNFQVEGGVTFHKADLEKLFGYITGG